MREQSNIPLHVAIIMDGNGRWAQRRGLPRIEGHRRGAERAKEIIKLSDKLGIRYLTLYAFSMENWHRPQEEVSFLMKLLELYLRQELKALVRDNVIFKAIGDREKLPKNIRALIEETEKNTSSNTGMTLITALSYGGRDEILRAIKRAISQGVEPEEITEESFSQFLDTKDVPPPDMIIRTSGEHRLSNFLLWQSAYSELYFTDTLWPDFTEQEYLKALSDYQRRERRFGALKESKGQVVRK